MKRTWTNIGVDDVPRVDDFEVAVQRARALVTRFEEEPHVNPQFSLRDPDGYYVTINAVSAA